MDSRGPSSDTDPPTLSLVASARQGDRNALSQLHERIGPALGAWAGLRLGALRRSGLDPEDLAQEVWLRVLAILDRYDPDRCSFRAWFFRVAKNVLLETLRGGRRGPWAEAEGLSAKSAEQWLDPATSTSRRFVRREGVERFVERVSCWPEEDLRLLIHCGLEGLSHAEAACRLGLSRDAAAKRWQRLRRKLADWQLPRELLDDW